MKSYFKIGGMALLGLLLSSFNVMAWEVSPQKVTQHVYAYIGPMDDRTPQNLGLNNNIGFVVTSQGVVLIDSGAGTASARALELGAKKISKQPIVAIINTGSQDHRWLGNAYFAQRGVKIYALAATVKTERKMARQLQSGLVKHSEKVFKFEKIVTAATPFKGNSASLKIGDTLFEIKRFGDTHFPGDAVVWLPQQKVLFSGDMIYVDRMLGIHPWSNVITWQKAYHQARKLPAELIVPGHGGICTWAKADRETGDYLDKLIKRLTASAENMAGVEQAVSENLIWPQFEHLKHYDDWHKRNVSRAYLRIEGSL